MIENLLISLLSIVGFYISLYFTLVYYGAISPARFPLPQVCRLSENTCQMIIKTRYARVLGLPNFVYGLFYYFFIFALAIFNWNGYIETAVKVISWLVVVLGIYLSYVLIKVLRVNCVLCFASHVLNFAIAVLLALK